MATIRLIPSTYALSNTSYLTIANAANMYHNTDNSSYATITNTRQSTTSYYLYIRGFNFNDIPSNAVINSFTVKLKGYETGLSTNVSYAPRLVNGTSNIANTTASVNLGATSNIITIPTGALTWEQIDNYGRNFGIRVYVRRNASGTTGYAYIQGAEIEVNYTIPNYYNIIATSAVQGITVSPSTQSILEGDSATISFEVDDISDYKVTDNDIDITNQLVRHQHTSGSQTATFIPSSFDSTNSVYNRTAGDSGNGIYSTNYIENGLTDHNSTTRCALYSVQGSNAVSYMLYNFDCSTIPSNAEISSVACQFKGGTQGSTYYNAYTAQLVTGSTGGTAKGNAVSVTGTNTSPSTVTINGGTAWTRAELDNIKIKFQVTRGTSNTTTDSTWSFYGATLSVDYIIPSSGHYYTYTINNVQEQHTVLLDEAGAFIPPEEDPQKTYYSITISSINATTNPSTGTTRVEAGTSETITITPTDPQLTLALDNGVDITNQLIGGIPSNTYTVTTQVTGASYGFNLNNSTGYYVSTNNGYSKTASVARLNLDFESNCLLTIQYINYAEATYDYGLFGKLDTTVATDGLTAGSGGSSPSDNASNYELMCNTSAYNTASAQTITYTVPAGTHYIDIKYGKDDASDANNDSLQWKVLSIEPTSGGGTYTYTLSNISQSHSLIFVFGNVNYYFITSSCSGGARLYPDGQVVKLQGDPYALTIVPDNTAATVTVRDNNVDVSSSLGYEEGEDKHGNIVVNYLYNLSNISAAHTITVNCAVAVDKIYVKMNGSWVEFQKVYKKINGSWVEQTDPSSIFDTTANYVKGN